MDAALEEIEFLALSPNRVATLEALVDGPKTRRDLEAETGASQPTLGRILRDFEERKWVSRGEEGYEVSATGRLVADGITDLCAIVETERRLREVVEWLPTEEMTFDLVALRDATITVPTRTRPGAPVNRVEALLEGATEVRIVSNAFNERSLEVVRRRAVDDDVSFEGVFAASAIDALAADAELRERLRGLLAADGAAIRIHEGDVPLAVTIADDVTHLLLRDDDGVLQAALDADDPRVRDWATDVHERYWQAATPLEAADLEA